MHCYKLETILINQKNKPYQLKYVDTVYSYNRFESQLK